MIRGASRPILLPSSAVLREFVVISEGVLAQRNNLREQNRKLREARDLDLTTQLPGFGVERVQHAAAHQVDVALVGGEHGRLPGGRRRWISWASRSEFCRVGTAISTRWYPWWA